RTPDQYADLIERFCRDFSERDKILVSAHAHNDQGMAVAATEFALRAGADRVEGTLFGHGERTGNVDLVTVALNLQFRGIETGLDFSNLPEIVRVVEKLTGMPVSARHPYAGELVTTAFSGSHQDAIRKCMDALKDGEWRVPYLHFDPVDLGLTYKDLIRINTQSGKGGAVWVLETQFGIRPPKGMHPEIGAAVQDFASRVCREITAQEVYDVFMREFTDDAKSPYSGPYSITGYWLRPDNKDSSKIWGKLRLWMREEAHTVRAVGNGPIDALVKCLHKLDIKGFEVEDYSEQAIGGGSEAKAIAFVLLRFEDGTHFFGVGVDANIVEAASKAIVAALNRHAIAKQRGVL
ncbi:MAG: alpha-isopropylmalate synthase regulatory domain-containing protein, partial [Nanoarchaeota archaeon]|nr:alpha-isopropylmalate synthase regulatory domain-containing protein [Nanoarchaeota archaeon]